MRRRGWRQQLDNRQTWVAVGLLVLVVAWGGPAWLAHGRRAYQRYNVAQWDTLIAESAQRNHLDPGLVRAVVLCESSGDRYAESGAGARGLMQITELTHTEAQRRFALPDGDLYDPGYNLRVGTRYLAYLLERFDGDPRLAVAAYHMGPTRVARLRRENPELGSETLVDRFAGPKTRAYVERVLDEWSQN